MSGWDFFSEAEREASDKAIARLCKAYDTRWSTLSAALGELGALRVVSGGGAVTEAGDAITKLSMAPPRPDGSPSRCHQRL